MRPERPVQMTEFKRSLRAAVPKWKSCLAASGPIIVFGVECLLNFEQLRRWTFLGQLACYWVTRLLRMQRQRNRRNDTHCRESVNAEIAIRHAPRSWVHH